MINKKRDGHIHTPFCPHGTSDEFELYVDKAIECGKKEITFTEHFPMPEGVTTPEFFRECALLEKEVKPYISKVKEIQQKYKEKIKINVGFEVDYIEGKENYIRKMLDRYGMDIEDAILSVHFLKVADKYYAVDYLPEFQLLLETLGSLEKVYDLYFQTILKSVEIDLGEFKPKRIGHPTLVRIFNKKFPVEYKNYELLKRVIQEIDKKQYQIDYNVAGLRKPYCGEVYPSGKFFELAVENNVQMIYGTDAHSSKEVGC